MKDMFPPLACHLSTHNSLLLLLLCSNEFSELIPHGYFEKREYTPLYAPPSLFPIHKKKNQTTTPPTPTSDIELRRRDAEKHLASSRKREREAEEEVKAKAKAEEELHKSFTSGERRDDRVSVSSDETLSPVSTVLYTPLLHSCVSLYCTVSG